MSEQPSPIDFLKAVYLNEGLPLATRMRAAIELLPFEHPKLSAIAVGHMNGADFSAQLDRAIRRSNEAKVPARPLALPAPKRD